MKQRGRQPAGGWDSWLDGVDWTIVVRGASAGFTILVISGLAHPILQRVGAAVGLAWLVLGSLAGFTAAAWRSGPAESPALTGLFAALFSYTLSVPLIYFSQRHLVWTDVLLFAAGAIVVGTLVGHFAGLRHVPDTKPPRRRPR